MSESAPELMRVPLGQLADVDPEVLPESTSPQLAFKYVDIASVSTGRIALPSETTAFAEAPSRARMKLRSGDVLMSTVRPNLKAFAQCRFDDDNVVASTGFAVIRAKENADSYFLLCSILSSDVSAQIERVAVGSNYPAINVGDVQRLLLPKFSLEEQRGIGAALRSLDNAIEAAEALTEKHQQIKAGLIHDLFTRGTPFNGQLRQHFAEASELFQETALGPLPLDWRRSTVGESFEIDSGITLGPHRRPARWPRKYLRVANVHRDQLRLDDVASIETLPGDDGYALEEGDLLVVEGHANPAEIGRCAMVDQDAAGMLFQNHLFRLRPNGIDKTFALLWLNSFHVQRYWERTCSTSSGLHTINRRMLRAVPMFVPSESEQTRIVSAAASARAVLDGHIKALAKLRAQKLGLMQDLLTGKVRVPLPKPEVPA